MTDLSIVLPGFNTQAYAHLVPSLEKSLVSITDLLTLDVVDIAKRAKLPILDLKRLRGDVLQALQQTFEIRNEEATGKRTSLAKTGNELVAEWNTVSTLDDTIDMALGGGVPTGYITEVTGESGAGKTQILLTLLLSVQLVAPHGLSRSSLYISTEAALPTTRLSQMLASHPVLSSADPKPSFDGIISIVTPDLESQDHILRYQLPVAIRRHNIGLVVIDSVAANYRAEFERPGAGRNGANMAKRSAELIKLGAFLRDLARTENLAVVVANQVADRFSGTPLPRHMGTSMSGPAMNRTQSSPLTHRSMAPPTPNPNLNPKQTQNAPSSAIPATPDSSGISVAELGLPSTDLNTHGESSDHSADIMTLDHQQRFFTGWGDNPRSSPSSFKTPSLGLIWTSQIACRIALVKKPVYGIGAGKLEEETERGEPVLKKWRRWMRVVFAPWAEGGGMGVEYEIVGAGVRAVRREGEGKAGREGEDE